MVARAWADSHYLDRVLNDPGPILARLGLQFNAAIATINTFLPHDGIFYSLAEGNLTLEIPQRPPNLREFSVGPPLEGLNLFVLCWGCSL